MAKWMVSPLRTTYQLRCDVLRLEIHQKPDLDRGPHPLLGRGTKRSRNLIFKRMEFTLKNFIFYGFALMTVSSALLVVTVRNIVHAAFSLMVTLFGVAGLYVFLQADFLAATQVIVYVGGILVLILFGVMMTSGRFEMPLQVNKSHIERGQLLLGGIIALALLMLLLTVIANTPVWKNLTDDGTELPPTTERIGELILNGPFLLPFEVVSVLLLVALIGAALISRKEVRE